MRSIRGRRRRVVKPPERRRRDLLAAAVRSFTAHGVGGATIDEIVQRAGVAKGTFYLYFQSKQELLAALQEQVSQEMLGRVERALARAGHEDWTALATALVGEIIEFYLENRDRFHLLRHGDHGGGSESIAHSEQRILQLMADFFRQGATAGAFALDDPEMTATLLFHGIHGAMVELGHRGDVSPARLRRAAVALTERALGHPPAR